MKTTLTSEVIAEFNEEGWPATEAEVIQAFDEQGEGECVPSLASRFPLESLFNVLDHYMVQEKVRHARAVLWSFVTGARRADEVHEAIGYAAALGMPDMDVMRLYLKHFPHGGRL